jgi:hypothetical protein
LTTEDTEDTEFLQGKFIPQVSLSPSFSLRPIFFLSVSSVVKQTCRD